MCRNIYTLFLVAMAAIGCQQYKPHQYQSTTQRGTGSAATQDSADAKPAVPTDQATELVVSTTKLKANPGAYTLVVRFLTADTRQEFTPSGSDARFKLANLPANEAGVMTVELFQDNKLKFVAKRANTKLEKAQANRIVVDDCLILPAPWDGSQHDGSCDWTIADK